MPEGHRRYSGVRLNREDRLSRRNNRHGEDEFHQGRWVSGVALQVKLPVRRAGLVEEDSEGAATYLAPVRVYAFKHLLLVIDRDRVEDEHIAEIVASANRDTRRINQAMDMSVSIDGHGYLVQLPVAKDAGFEIGDSAPVKTGWRALAIHQSERQ